MADNHHFLTQIAQGFEALKRVPEINYEYNSRELVFEYQKVKLFRYHTAKKSRRSVPLLVVFATVNRPEVLDLFPETSLIGGLIAKGVEVYMLDWGYPDQADKDLSLNNYLSFLDNCVQFMLQQHACEKIDLLGVCQGGVLTLCYTALFQHIKNLVLISTPIDFHTRDNALSNMLRKIELDAALSENVNGAMLTNLFISLRLFELTGKKYLRFIDNLSDPVKTEKFLRVEKWLHDAPDQAGRAFKEFLQDFYQQNKLIKTEINFAGKKVDLKNVTLPILNVMTREDHIVPMSASKPLKKYIASNDYTQKTFASGHIGIYISEKVGASLAKTIASWLSKR